MKDETRWLTLEIYDPDKPEGEDMIKSHRVLWYSHNSRDFIVRNITWALRTGLNIELAPEPLKRADHAK